MARLYSMAVLRSCGRHWIMISRKRRSSLIRISRWMRSSTTLLFFVSRLWQIHVFGEGNTRTTAVFFIKYLRTLGFDVPNDVFAENAWYFRNSLVWANYNDLKNGIHETTEFLEVFLRNLLLNENHPLHNRTLTI